MLTQLQIVERDTLFVVQIRKQKFFTRRWWWQDIGQHLSDSQRILPTKNGKPLLSTKFSTQKKAETYCENFLAREQKKSIPDEPLKTYNTGLDGFCWGSRVPMPECDPPKKP